MAKDIPVYMFTGFLEAGKTRFIQETLKDPRFNDGDRTLLIMCEEGIEELDPSDYPCKDVFVEYIEDFDDITTELLSGMAKKCRAERVMVEFNGMWLLQDFAKLIPDNWVIYQEFMFADSQSFLNYNANMRSLMVDKLRGAELVVLNRASDSLDREEIHKVIRGITRRAAIAYEYPDGKVEYDDIEDPLPFDINAPVIEIEDSDFAIWYRDMSEELPNYAGKVVRFKGVVAINERMPEGIFIAGRHIMTCCIEDIEYSGLVCKWPDAKTLHKYQWVTVTGKIDVRFHRIYGGKGPVVTVTSIEPAEKPAQEVATFY